MQQRVPITVGPCCLDMLILGREGGRETGVPGKKGVGRGRGEGAPSLLGYVPV